MTSLPEHIHLDIHDRSSREDYARLFGVIEGQLRKAVRPAGGRPGMPTERRVH